MSALPDDFPGDQVRLDAQQHHVAGELSAGGHHRDDAQPVSAPGSPSTPAGPIVAAAPTPHSSRLAYSLLAAMASQLDDFETLRIQQVNRLGALLRPPISAPPDHPDVAAVEATVEALRALEHGVTLQLSRALRRSPLGPWAKAQVGLGDKQVGRLLGAIGDPYWRYSVTKDGEVTHDGPRTVSQLWAYCGMHVLHPGQVVVDAHRRHAGVEPSLGGDAGHGTSDTHPTPAGVAPSRTRGQQANWSEDARKRVWLIATSCIKQKESPYRPVYDETRAKYAEAVHAVECRRCGPKGWPAPAGSPLSDGHKHARGLRAVSKAILRDMWVESRRLHEQGVR